MSSTSIDGLIAVIFANTNVEFESCRVYDCDTFGVWMRYRHQGLWPHPDSLSVETANLVKLLARNAFTAFNVDVTITDVVTHVTEPLWYFQVNHH